MTWREYLADRPAPLDRVEALLLRLDYGARRLAGWWRRIRHGG